ncbi:uncharacterized protein [Chiloscyllium punctatum]
MAYSFEVVDRAHCRLLLDQLNEQRLRGRFCDVTIVVQDSKFKAHKNILAAFSCYFRERLSGPVPGAGSSPDPDPGPGPGPGPRGAEPVLELREIRAEVFAKILNFIYSSRVVIERLEEADALASAGHRLGIHFLKELLRPSPPPPAAAARSPSPGPRKARAAAAAPTDPGDPSPGPRLAIDLTGPCPRRGADAAAAAAPPHGPSGRSGEPTDGAARGLLTLSAVAVRGLGFEVEPPRGPAASSSSSSSPSPPPPPPGEAERRDTPELSCRHCLRPFVHLKRLRSHQTVCARGAEREPEPEPPGPRGNGGKSRRRDTPPGGEGDDHVVKVVDGHVLYSCAVCERSYVTLSSLKRHANVHSWRRRYPCRFCDKVFALAEYRTKHEVWHTGERRYQCIFCWEAFVTYYNLKTHQKSFHGVDPGLTISQKTPNGGYKPKLNAFKLYRLLPMRSHKRPYKTYSHSAPQPVAMETATPTVSVETAPPTASVETPPTVLVETAPPTVSMETPPTVLVETAPPTVSMETPPTVLVETAPPTVSMETLPPTVLVETAPPTVSVETAPPTILVETAPPTVLVETAPPTVSMETAPPTVLVETAPPTVSMETPPPAIPVDTAPPTVPMETTPSAVSTETHAHPPSSVSPTALPSSRLTSLCPEGSTASSQREPSSLHQRPLRPFLGPEGVTPGHSVITYGGPPPPSSSSSSSSSVIVALPSTVPHRGQSTVIAYNGKCPPEHHGPGTVTTERPASGRSPPIHRDPSPTSARQSQKEPRGSKVNRQAGGAGEGRTMTYVAKPACPGTANESRSAPLCCITVRIGEEAFVKRRISESDLIRDEGGASCTEGAEGEHQPRVRRRRRRRRRRRSDGYSLGQDSEDEDSDREDNLWRPYYSYKPKRRAPGSLHRPRRVGWHRRLRYRPPPPGTPPPACPPPPPSATEGTHHQCKVPGDGDLPAVPGIPREGLWPPSPRGPADTDGDPSPRANGRRTLAGRHLGNRLAKTDPSAPAGGGSRPLGEGEEGAGTSRPDLRTRLPTIGVDPDAAVSCPSPREVTVAQPAHGEGKRTAEPRGGESVMDARGRLLAPTCPAPADWEPLRDTGMASKNRLVQDGTGPAHRTLVPEDGESRALGTLDTGGPYPPPTDEPVP